MPTAQVTDWGTALITSITGALMMLAAGIPRLIAFILIVLVGWFVAGLLARGVAVHGRADQLALQPLAAEFEHELALRLVLDPHGGDVEPKVVREPDQRGETTPQPLVLARPLHQRGRDPGAVERHVEHDGHQFGVEAPAIEREDAHDRRVLQQSGLVAARVDTDLRYVWVDNVHPAFDPAAVIGKRDYDIADNEGTHALVALKRELIDTGRGMREEITFPAGEEARTYAVHGEPLLDENGSVIGMTTVSLDVTDMHRVEVAAHTDYLTGAHDRRGIDDLVVHEIERTERYGGTFSVILVDIDHFKAVNDAHGHQAGDQALQEVVTCLGLELRSVDQIGRWVGEARAALVARADATMYRAKNGGRNTVVADAGDGRA